MLLWSCKEDESPPPAVVEKVPITPPSIETKLNATAKSHELPSIAICVVNKDSIVWDHYYGFADVEQSIEADRNTIYTVASVSKLVTSTAVMQLVEQGLLDLDEDINEYLPFSVRHPLFKEVPITTRMLLKHRSGMSSPFSMDDSAFFDPYEDESAPDLGPWVEGYLKRPVAWLNFSPDTGENYSNHGAALLGYIVELIVGQDFNEYCKEQIFEPLGMSNTSFNLDDINKSLLSIPYHNEAHFQYSVPYYPATSLKTSLNDFSKFISMFINNGRFGEKTLLKTETVQEAIKIQQAGSALGFLWWSFDGGWKGHSGAYFGSTTIVDFHQQNGLGTIVFTNKTQWLLRDRNVIWPGGEIYKLVHDHAKSLR